ncbi:hypothetical protein LHK_01598 [Laribacter hongkongensis HLHK9]|uniref:Uncharacterized protein n=2 Tax=Laribacter hongkongensis TaxID=168471 RepID=C1D7Z2_LARHH|nr:hypothetical protein LHK_01598 [Laribacter hongkongensis HLHK9]ASJ24746.1 hypothetical protein LHGZ1_1915 [Laribacter hongkongensis]
MKKPPWNEKGYGGQYSVNFPRILLDIVRSTSLDTRCCF